VRILIVEDDRKAAELLAKGLRELTRRYAAGS
jgi:DNA-binding response OmpR family regulator